NARWYDADLGRFISEDPVADPNNPNLYSYTANNPLRWIDPTGLYFSDDWAAQDAADEENTSFFTESELAEMGYGGNSGDSGSESSCGPETPPTPEPKTQEDGPSTKEGPNPNPGVAVETPVAPPTLEEAKEAYKTAAEALEKARETKGTNPDAFREAQEKFNNALDDLLKAAGYDTSKYNHNTVVWVGDTYIHVNSNPQVVIAVVELANKLGADKVVITEGDRTKKEHDDLYKDKPKDKQVKYETTEHGSAKGYMAADVQFYKDGTMVDKETAFSTAKTITEIGGIGIYSFNSIHVDLRERVNGQPTTWDWR
ncbi:MAG: hypothetical protein GX075_03990, partial [Firmicutes bacterium]|nr:hypothetical protein [Bacillota bacterium]